MAFGRTNDTVKPSDFLLTGKFYSVDGKQITGITNPKTIDNRQLCSPTDNQGSTPHCAAYSCAQYLESIYWKNTGIPIQLNAKTIFEKAKTLDGLDKNIEGTTLNAALDAGINLCGWDETKYKTEIFSGDEMTEKNLIEYVKFLIHKHDFMLTGFTITKSWEKCGRSTSFSVGNTGKVLGGHCVLGCGYDTGNFYIQNSWGKAWGAYGFGMVPWDIFYDRFEYCAWIKKVHS